MSNKKAVVIGIILMIMLGIFILINFKKPITGTIAQAGTTDGTFTCTYDYCVVQGVMACTEKSSGQIVVLRFTNPDFSSGWVAVNEGGSELVPYRFSKYKEMTTTRTDDSACIKSGYYFSVRGHYGNIYLADYNRQPNTIVIIKPERKGSSTLCKQYYYTKAYASDVPSYFPLTISSSLQYLDREIYNQASYQCQASLKVNGKEVKKLTYAGNSPKTVRTPPITIQRNDTVSFLPYKIEFKSYYNGCGRCTLGDAQCVDNHKVRVCQMVNATFCDWVTQDCKSPMICSDGACQCPSDGNYCSLTEYKNKATKCKDNKVYACSQMQGSCPVWTLQEDCTGEGMICKD